MATVTGEKTSKPEPVLIEPGRLFIGDEWYDSSSGETSGTEQIKAGTVWINTWHHYDPSAPFGGYRQSGYGREHGPESLDAYTQVKTVWLELDR